MVFSTFWRSGRLPATPICTTVRLCIQMIAGCFISTICFCSPPPVGTLTTFPLCFLSFTMYRRNAGFSVNFCEVCFWLRCCGCFLILIFLCFLILIVNFFCFWGRRDRWRCFGCRGRGCCTQIYCFCWEMSYVFTIFLSSKTGSGWVLIFFFITKQSHPASFSM